ncbi:MAG: hypothetical protein KDE14_07250 [Rhodobacteraceae bacterium]|nr:hypothetical protein [Paracoccaceae bacterium]
MTSSAQMHFPSLVALLTQIEEAEEMFQIKTANTYDEAKIAAAAKTFNAILEKAAQALVVDMGDTPEARKYFDDWKPRTATDTWFGPQPGKFVRHAIETGKVHRGFLPDQSAVR